MFEQAKSWLQHQMGGSASEPVTVEAPSTKHTEERRRVRLAVMALAKEKPLFVGILALSFSVLSFLLYVR